MQVEFKLKNPDKLQHEFEKLIKKNQASMNELVRVSVREIAREARQRAPYRLKKKGKHYKNMFRWRSFGSFGWAAPMRRGNKTSSLGHILEFGSVHARPFPHLMPAFRRVRDAFEGQLRRRVERAARSL